MSISTLIAELKANGYRVNHSDKIDNDIFSISIYKAEKGKVFSKKLILFAVDSFNYEYFDKLIDFIKINNKKNNLCIALCNVSNILDSKTMYMVDNENGVCIIHFVYFDNKNESYIYDLNFNYSQSKTVKKAILELVKIDDSSIV